jgi:hypothetical protein
MGPFLSGPTEAAMIGDLPHHGAKDRPRRPPGRWVPVDSSVSSRRLKAGRLDDIQIHIVPVLLGEGRRLFERLGTDQIELEGTRVIDSPGVTHLRFRPGKKDGG